MLNGFSTTTYPCFDGIAGDGHAVAEDGQEPYGINHTPGPWRVSGTKWHSTTSVRAANDKAVAIFSWVMIEALGRREAEANARLIAAAPDLLQAVRNCVITLESPVSEKEKQDAVARARAALAKASA